MEAKLLENARFSAAKFALNGYIGDTLISEVASEMLNISSAGLQRRNKVDARQIDERQFLDPLFYILENKETGAEKLLYKYNKSWNKNIDMVFKENAF
jgi:glutamate--cysteine ligase